MRKDPIEESRRLYQSGRWQYIDTDDTLDLGPLGYFAVHTMRGLIREENISGYLDVGGGEGTVGRMVLPAASPVVLDPVIPALVVAGGRGAITVGGDGRYIPFRDNAFDLVMLNDVLEHIPQSDVSVMLREAIRVLRPGGIALISTSAFGVYMLRWLRPGPPGRLDADDVTDGHLNRLGKYELFQYLAGVGFKIERFVFYKHFFQPLFDLPLRVFKVVDAKIRGKGRDYSGVSKKANKNSVARVINRLRCWVPFLDVLFWGKWAGGAVIVRARKPERTYE